MPPRAERPRLCDPVLVGKYPVHGFDYRCYPPLDGMAGTFNALQYRDMLRARHSGWPSRHLALYVALVHAGGAGESHEPLPLDALRREIDLVGAALAPASEVQEIHVGGLPASSRWADDLAALLEGASAVLDVRRDAGHAVDLAPTDIAAGTLPTLAALGFRRIALRAGADAPVTARAVDAVMGFRGSAFDEVAVLVPRPAEGTSEAFEATVAVAAAAGVDRIVLGRREPEAPRAESDAARRGAAQDRARVHEALGASRYEYLGLHEFARSDHPLHEARRQGRLGCDWRGFGAPAADVIGVGAGAVSSVNGLYVRNAATMARYRGDLDRGILPVARGRRLDQDDLLRRTVIHGFACHREVSRATVGQAFLVDFDRYFRTEQPLVAALADDGVLEVGDDWIVVTPRGAPFVNAVCAVFDRCARTRPAHVAGSPLSRG